LPAEAEESALTSIPCRPPTIRQSGYIGKEHNDAASMASAVTSNSFDNDSSIDVVGERLGCFVVAARRQPAAASCCSSGRPPARSSMTASILPGFKHKQLLALRRRIQVIFQDPYSSLNPRMKLGDLIAYPSKRDTS